MNTCVKTGFIFLNLDEGKIRTGDLFYIGDMFQIRGVPHGEYPIGSGVELDAAVSNCVLANRADSPLYMDSNVNIFLVNPSPAFVAHIKKWYPELVQVVER